VAIGPLLSLAGCATTDELDAMRATMNATISANKRSLDGRIHQLEELKKKWEEQQAQMTKSMQDTAARISELDKDYQARFSDQARALTGYQDSIGRLSDTVKANAGDLAELRQSLQSEEGAMLRILDAEEAFHKEGLRSVQSIRNDLSAGKGRYYKSRGTTSMRREATDDLTVGERLLR
jgi:septal ring factor EnvC (AmiA/AmiB activator)